MKGETIMDELTRENAVEINEWMGDIDTAVQKLIEYQKMGKSVYVNFNGHKLYSCDITLDGAYKEITGMTKAESDKAREEARKKWELERKEKKEQAERKIPEWISDGEKNIFPERAEDWQYYVETSARQGMYYGSDIAATLEIMGMLEGGASFEDVEKKLEEQGHSGHSYSIVTKNVLHFSKNGPDFYEAVVLKGKPDPESAMALEEIRKENEVFAKRLDKSASVSLLDKLKGIKKDELSERKFYEQVLSVVKEMRESYEITKDEEAFVNALREIGCLSSEEWMEAKQAAGEQVPELTVGEGIRSADIGTAVSIISNYMSSPDFMQSYMNDRIRIHRPSSQRQHQGYFPADQRRGRFKRLHQDGIQLPHSRRRHPGIHPESDLHLRRFILRLDHSPVAYRRQCYHDYSRCQAVVASQLRRPQSVRCGGRAVSQGRSDAHMEPEDRASHRQAGSYQHDR